MIKVIGIGIDKGDITTKAKKAIKESTYVLSREKNRYATECASVLFADAESFDELNEKIVERLLAKEKAGEKVAFLVVGDGFGDEASATLEQKTQVEYIAGVGEYRGRKQSTSIVSLSAYDVSESTCFNTALPHLIYQIDSRDVASDLKLALLDYYDEDVEVTISDKNNSKTVPLCEIDMEKKYVCAALYIPSRADYLTKHRFEFNDILRLFRRLTAENGCPWDKVQTHESIRTNMIEEAYEAVDAIDKEDTENLIEELGDVLMQVVLHADIARRSGEFDVNDVISRLGNKLVFRHEHVFGENKAHTETEALNAWEKVKAKEKHFSTLSEQVEKLPDSFPATLLAQKVIKRVNKFGGNISPEDCMEKFNVAIKEKQYGKAIMFAIFYATLCGADCETELNTAVKNALETAKTIENRNVAEFLGEVE